ncbi:5217_t:CDS:2, partial [Diversispora eburnea]
TDPVIEVHDGIQWVVFTYSVKGNNKEYRIRIDIDNVNLDNVDEKFRQANCLYPRANCTEDKYQGNRWAYEKVCNELGWKLSWLNQEEIGGKRGLLQRAVDSYRNRDPSLRSRRVVRNEKIMNGTLRKRITRDNDTRDGGLDNSNNNSNKRQRNGSKQLTVETVDKGIVTKIRIRADIECVNISVIPDDFKRDNCVYSKALVPKENYQGTNWETETACNELGWKLAYMNRPKLDGKGSLLQTVVDMYRDKYTREPRPRRGRYSHTLSAKFFENHPREITTDPNSTSPIAIDNNLINAHLKNRPTSEELCIIIGEWYNASSNKINNPEYYEIFKRADKEMAKNDELESSPQHPDAYEDSRDDSRDTRDNLEIIEFPDSLEITIDQE